MNELETLKATMTNYEKLKNELLFGQIIFKPPTCRLFDTLIKVFCHYGHIVDNPMYSINFDFKKNGIVAVGCFSR